MKPAQIAVVGIALLAALGAGVLAFSLAKPKPAERVVVAAAPAQKPVKLTKVLATTRAVAMGEKMDGAMAWQPWPEEAVGGTLITKSAEPDAIDKLKDMIARQSFFAGEPIRKAKLVSADQGLMSALLPAGKRAVAVQISAGTSAGGFIMPGDHVDVIMTRKDKDATGDDGVRTETVLRNLRVLAIDQTAQDKEGQKTAVGSTATLEVDPQQAEALTAAQQIASKLVLSLRSLADSVPGSPGYAAFLLAQEKAKQNKVKVVRYGETTEITTDN